MSDVVLMVVFFAHFDYIFSNHHASKDSTHATPLSCCWSCTLFCRQTPIAQTKPKNVILIVADDLGMQLGCYGDPHIKVIAGLIDRACQRRGAQFPH